MNKNKNLDKKNWKLINFSEIDKYATTSYCAIHNVNEELNLGDITRIDETRMEDFDLMTYGFPCQDISLSGKQKGFVDKDGNKTRSGLFFDALRIIKEKKPKIAIAENVKNLTSKKFQKEFDIVLTSLNEAGYNNYWKVLNAKDFGIPQNRERVFIVSIRKDIDNGMFEFPKGFELKLRLKDMLEDAVDEKYYLSDEKIQKIKNSNFMQEKTIIQKSDVCSTLLARDYKDPKCVEVNAIRKYGIFDDEKGKHQAGSVWDKEGLAPTLDTMQGGYRQPCIEIKEATKKGYAEAEVGDSINLEQPNSKTRRGRVGKQVAQTLTTSCNQAIVEPQILKTDVSMPVRVRKYKVDCDKLVNLLRKAKEKSGLTNKDISLQLDIPLTKVEHWFRKDSSFAIPDEDIWFKLKEILKINTDEFDKSITTFEEREGVYEKLNRCYLEEGIAPTLTRTSADEKVISNLRIRKLTPLECWRLMGFSDDQFSKAKKSLNDKHYKGKDKSNSQLYKQAGNSIVVDVLFYIFIELYKTMPQVFNDLKVTSLFSGIGAFEVALDRLYKLLNQMN